jgi:shikimate dehydrogenase
MHGAVIAKRRLPLRYVPLDVPPEAFPDLLRLARKSANILGGNVTIPHKEAAAALADERSRAAELCGAANVLVVRDGRLLADNTDGSGLLDAFEEAGWGRVFGRVAILGAGGAARGVASALLEAGAASVVILNRTERRAGELAELMGAAFPSRRIGTAPLDAPSMEAAFRDADLVVQCTSLGLRERFDSFPAASVPRRAKFADIVYKIDGNPLVRALRRRGVAAMDGLPMLAHQAARSFALWTGISVPGREFLAAARAEARKAGRGKG